MTWGIGAMDRIHVNGNTAVLPCQLSQGWVPCTEQMMGALRTARALTPLRDRINDQTEKRFTQYAHLMLTAIR